MPFTGDTFFHLFDWEKDPQRQEKLVNSRLETELDGLDIGLSTLAGRITPLEGGVADDSITNAKLANMPAYTIKMRNAGTTGDPSDVDISALTEKTTLANADLFLIQDSAASNAFKKVQKANVATAFDINALTEDTAPAIATDFGPTYDVSGLGNKKVKPIRYDGTVRHSVSNTDTAINSLTNVTITTDSVAVAAGVVVEYEAEFTILNNSGAGRNYNFTLEFGALLGDRSADPQ
jgi:hypothetical protein